MIQAPTRTSNPIGIPYNESLDIKHALVKTEFKVGSYPKIKSVTLSYIEILEDEKTRRLPAYPCENVIIVAGTILHDGDNQSRPEGRGVANDRLLDYLQYGRAKRHANGKTADHFIVQVTKEEFLNDSYWKTKCARLMLENSFLNRIKKNNNYTFTSTEPTYGC